jgi:hypothetical protein
MVGEVLPAVAEHAEKACGQEVTAVEGVDAVPDAGHGCSEEDEKEAAVHAKDRASDDRISNMVLSGTASGQNDNDAGDQDSQGTGDEGLLPVLLED